MYKFAQLRRFQPALALLFAALALSGCGQSKACYGISSREALRIAQDYQNDLERRDPQSDMFGIPISQIKPTLISLDAQGGRGEDGETRVLFTDKHGKRWASLSIYGDCEEKLFSSGDGMDYVNGVPFDSWDHAIPASAAKDHDGYRPRPAASSAPHLRLDHIVWDSGLVLHVEADRRTVSASDRSGRRLWREDPFEKAGMKPYRFPKPVIVFIGPFAHDQFRQGYEATCAAKGEPAVDLAYNSTQFGCLNARTGRFVFLGQD